MTAQSLSLLDGRIGPHLWRLSAPIGVGLLAITFCNLAEAWFISRLGTTHLVAFGFILPVVMMFMGVIFGFSIGTTSALSRVYGGGDTERMRQMTTDALTLTFITVTAAAVAGFFLIDTIFPMMGAGEAVLPLIREYMRVWYFSLPLLGMIMIANAAIRGTGDTRFPGAIMVANAVLIFVLEPVLIFGFFGVPRLELAGAAMALVLADMVILSISLFWLARVKKSLSARLVHPEIFTSWKKILHVAVPGILGAQIAPFSLAAITWMASGFGREAVAALGVANRIEAVVMLVFYSCNGGISIFAGQNHGAGNYGRIREALNVGARFSLLYGFVCAVVLWVLANVLPPLFDSDPHVVAYTAKYLHWVPVSYGALGIMILSSGIFNATGRPFPATAIIFMKAFVLYIPMAWLLKDIFGFHGILFALILTNCIIAAISYTWNRRVVV